MFEPDSLRMFLTPGAERVGFILKDGTVVEVENTCEIPDEGFEVLPEDIERHHDDVVATWHTHPGASSNLSVGDMESFRTFPDWRHFIVGQDGVTEYYVEGTDVFIAT